MATMWHSWVLERASVSVSVCVCVCMIVRACCLHFWIHLWNMMWTSPTNWWRALTACTIRFERISFWMPSCLKSSLCHLFHQLWPLSCFQIRRNHVVLTFRTVFQSQEMCHGDDRSQIACTLKRAGKSHFSARFRPDESQRLRHPLTYGLELRPTVCLLRLVSCVWTQNHYARNRSAAFLRAAFDKVWLL